jgi:hypothetical protein
MSENVQPVWLTIDPGFAHTATSCDFSKIYQKAGETCRCCMEQETQLVVQ